MRYLLVLIFSNVFFSFPANAQNRVLDSLHKLMENHAADSTAATYYYEMAYYYDMNERYDSSDWFLEKLYDFSTQKNLHQGLADYYHLRLTRTAGRQQYDSAKAFGWYELEAALKSGKDTKIAFALNALGNLNIHLGNGDSAVIYLLKGLPFARRGSKRLSINILYNLGAAYNMIENFLLARNYSKKAYEEAIVIDDANAIFNGLFNWASMESKLGNNDTALLMYRQLAAMAKASNNHYNLIDVLNNVGEVYYDLKKYPQSLNQYNQMAEILKEGNDPENELYLYMNRGNTLIALNRFAEALTDLKKATEIGIKLNAGQELMHVYQFRSQLAERTNNFKDALTFRKAADSLQQLNINEQSRKHIQQLEVRYQTAQKDLAISQQKIDLIRKENAIKKKNTENLVLLAGCILLVLVLFLVYRILRQKGRLAMKEKALHNSAISELKKKHQLDAMHSILRGQEDERSRLAKDLHDGVGGQLSGVKLGLSTMRGNNFLSEENAHAVQRIIGQLDNSIMELRRVSHNMMPEALVKFGLKEALENYCENINQAGGLKVVLQTYGLEARMEQDVEISLYRIVQELLNNVIKHANAGNVLIQLTRQQDTFSLTVEDNGKGFDINAVNASGSAGLRNIESRASLLNGNVDYQTRPGEGTSVTIFGNCSNG